MEFCEINNDWDTFHQLSIYFYLIYGFILTFAHKSYFRHIYFRNRWFNVHDNDKILEYNSLLRGVSYILVGILTGFSYKSLDPTITYNTDLINISKNYMITQISFWIFWLCIELYYTLNSIEWPLIGVIHILYSSTVIYYATMVCKQFI